MGDVGMAGSRSLSAASNGGGSRRAAEAQPNDTVATWSREQLARMDSDFCTRVRIAFRAGGESMSAATATYDLPARRQAR
jgi:hypothetical protein